MALPRFMCLTLRQASVIESKGSELNIHRCLTNLNDSSKPTATIAVSHRLRRWLYEQAIYS